MLSQARVPSYIGSKKESVILMDHIDTGRCGRFLALFPGYYPQSLDQAETLGDVAAIMAPYGPFSVGLGHHVRGINRIKIYRYFGEALRAAVWNTPDGCYGYIQSGDGQYIIAIDCT